MSLQGKVFPLGVVLFLVGPLFLAADPPLKIGPPGADGNELIGALGAKEQKRVGEAIEGGIAFLRRTQLKSGSWILGVRGVGDEVETRHCPAGIAALVGLTLLECGVPAPDAGIQAAARFVRAHAPTNYRTYELSLAILFLDRLGVADDRQLIKSLSLRLIAGQTHLGGWGYNCPILTPAQEKKLVEHLRDKETADAPKFKGAPDLKTKGPKETKLHFKDNADHSNTQFAILALWAARKHDLPMRATFFGAENRFRATQQPDGWSYMYRTGADRKVVSRPYGSMTCVGLLALAVGRASTDEGPLVGGEKNPARQTDDGIRAGLHALGHYLSDPTDTSWGGAGALPAFGPKGALNLYLLWSVERVGVFCNLETIGGKDWYRWGVDLLLPAQRPDGSWLGRGSGGFPAVDTCFALLFLKRSDLLPDLRETLQKRLNITDPGLDGKGVTPKKSPGETPTPKSGSKEKSPGEKSDNPDKKGAIKKSSSLVTPATGERRSVVGWVGWRNAGRREPLLGQAPV